MEFDLDDDQRALRDEARRFLAREAPIGYARAMMDDERGRRDDVWDKMAGLGWMALPFPEEHGGLGLGFVGLSIVLAEMGRVVLPGPYFSTVAAAGAAILEAASPAQRAALLPAIGSGRQTFALALGDAGDSWDDVAVEAKPGGAAWLLSGEKRFVVDGAHANRFIVAARAPDGVALFVTGDERISRRPLSTIDRTRRAADVGFDGAAAERLGEGPAPVEAVVDRVAAALAAEMLGGAERALEMAVEYAKSRVQFDRPIGSFQAVKHRAADMLLDVESLRNAVYYAAWAVDRAHPDASLAASMAKAYASDAYRRVAAGCIQIHGGIGFTWEHDAHLFFKRAKSSEVACGDATRHRERMATILRARYATARDA